MVVDVYRAARSGSRGEDALLAAVSRFDAAASQPSGEEADLQAARAELSTAGVAFGAMHDRLSGSMLAVARVTPFIRVQVRAADQLAEAGRELSVAGEDLASVATGLLSPQQKELPLKDALGELRTLNTAAAASVAALQNAEDQVAPLAADRLVGPIASARASFFAKLPKLQARLSGSHQALTALEEFLGASGPRQYLVLTQNPDEVRPTGGYIGTYGLMTVVNGHVSLPLFGDMSGEFLDQHPNVYVPVDQGPTAFKISGYAQTIANVNATPDWPTAAQLAIKMWAKAGQPPVNGVVSITPDFLARVVGVLGPVAVPEYGEVINASNLQARTDYWAHQNPHGGPAGRKGFLSDLARAVLQEALDAPASRWHPLANAVAAGFNAGQAMMWSSDKTIEAAVSAHAWDHPMPVATPTGDFYDDSEFEYAAKNGSGLRRVFHHDVVLKADGSGQATTEMDLANTLPRSTFSATSAVDNQDSPDYVVAYGPGNATLDGASDTPWYAYEPDLAGHPADGWLLYPAPLTTVHMKAIWDDPTLLTPAGPNRWIYRLVFTNLPGHTGDVVDLHVQLPRGWRWVGSPPPTEISLDKTLSGAWTLTKG